MGKRDNERYIKSDKVREKENRRERVRGSEEGEEVKRGKRESYKHYFVRLRGRETRE